MTEIDNLLRAEGVEGVDREGGGSRGWSLEGYVVEFIRAGAPTGLTDG